MREVLAILRRTYCQTLGVEFMHISDPAQKATDARCASTRGPTSARVILHVRAERFDVVGRRRAALNSWKMARCGLFTPATAR